MHFVNVQAIIIIIVFFLNHRFLLLSPAHLDSLTLIDNNTCKEDGNYFSKDFQLS